MSGAAVDRPTPPGADDLAGTPARERSRTRTVVHWLPVVLIPVAIIGIWELYCRASGIDPTVLPAPSRIAEMTWRARDVAATHTWQTVQETLIGFGASIVFAIAIALLMDQVAVIRRGLYPLLVGSQTIPIIAIAPLMIIWFGFGLLPKVLVVILVTFFPIVVALLDGLASTEREAMNLLKTMGASRWQMLRNLRIPTALPFFFTGMRIAATYAVVAAIFAEYVGAYQGLGIWMQVSNSSFRTDLVFGAILITALLSIVLFVIIYVISRLAIPWYYASRQQPS